ncbi:hypothetical protein HYN59_03360 [Flavobacterium album]|uniref:DUF4890 domain-containing protein n=1 Tax=Flavobacterium album TaxID=2175091 RepID=A0A2S1QUW1_9FLAO|nr:hypothetical protein [Flavobacterium album]AWH84208.1 hypothetical protein HYN59_03360 [Flavobacterium album]
MKKLMHGAGLIVALFLFTVSMSAQDRKAEGRKAEGRNPEAMAKLLTDNMKNKLSLNDEQYKKAYDANLEFLNGAKELKTSEGHTVEKGKGLKELDSARDEKMKAILTDEQFGQFLVMKKENREKMRERRKPRE